MQGKTVRIYLVRHGKSGQVDENGFIRNIPGLGLTEEGIKQAKATAKFLKKSAIQIVYSSDLPRARETAEIIAEELNVEVVTFEWLREFSIGELEGAPFWQHLEVIRNLAYPVDIKPDDKLPGGESIRELSDRIIPELRKLLKDCPQKICIVAHGGVNRVIITNLLEIPFSAFTRIDQENACVNILDVSEKRTLLRMLNYVPYDALKNGIEVGMRISI